MCVCCAFSIERERSFKQTLADYRQQDFRWSPRVIPIILLDGNKANRSSSFAQASVEDARTDPIFHVSIVQTRDRNRRWRDAEGTDANTRDPSRPYELLSFLWNIAKKKKSRERETRATPRMACKTNGSDFRAAFFVAPSNNRRHLSSL